MLEGIEMTTPRAVPCPFLGIGVALVNHLYNQVAVQAHRRLAIDKLILERLSHELDPPFEFPVL
jgi:hypothetical protein